MPEGGILLTGNHSVSKAKELFPESDTPGARLFLQSPAACLIGEILRKVQPPKQNVPLNNTLTGSILEFKN